ncbi:MAG: hypothetical protein QOE82_2132 [Thermoanaerobaculia bacterium]|jgi:hypothetical protein|nr:hypothetical protein [Thermoanaerobaculia bacterium]
MQRGDRTHARPRIPSIPSCKVILTGPIMRSPRVNQTFIVQLSDSPPS